MPSLDLPSTDGGSVNLAEFDARSVLFIYPFTGRPGQPDPPNWDDIPGAHGSTPQAQGFARLHPAFIEQDYHVFGVSSQVTSYQQEAVERLALPFPLLSDASFRLADALKLPRFETGEVAYLRRMTLMIEYGKIRQAFYPTHPPEACAREALAWIGARNPD